MLTTERAHGGRTTVKGRKTDGDDDRPTAEVKKRRRDYECHERIHDGAQTVIAFMTEEAEHLNIEKWGIG